MIGRIVRRSTIRSPQPNREAKLEDLLLQWGDWVRGYDPTWRQSSAPVAEAFAFAHTAYVEIMDFLLPQHRETMAAIDSCIEDVGAREYRWKLVLHWHYAHNSATSPAVWRHARLPAFASDDYNQLLDAARDALLAKMLSERMTHLLDC